MRLKPGENAPATHSLDSIVSVRLVCFPFLSLRRGMTLGGVATKVVIAADADAAFRFLFIREYVYIEWAWGLKLKMRLLTGSWDLPV